MATPEEFTETLSQLVEGMRQLTEAVRTAAVTETEAEKTARETAERASKAADRAEDAREYLQNRRKAAEEAAINQELERLGRRLTIDGKTERLEETHLNVLSKINAALTASTGVFSGLTGATLEAMKAQVKQQALVDNHLEQINKQIESSIAYTTSQANQIRMANMALKEKQREVEASKNLGNLGLRQQEIFQESIGKLKNQLDSTVQLTNQQYKEINAVEQAIKARNKEIDDVKNAGKNLASMVGSIKDVSSALGAMKEKQLEAAEGNATATAGIIAKFALFNIGLGLATNAFDLLVAGVKGYYEGILATQRALYAGERGEKVAQAANIAMLKALGAQAKASSDNLINLGKEAAAAGIAIAFMIPGSFLFKAGIAALGLVVGGVTAAMGAAEKVAGELAERQAEVLEMYAEQMDALFNGFSELGKASMIGARGMSGLYDNLHKVGFTVKEFDKLNKVLQTNAKDMKMFGVTASEGVDKFVEVASGLVYGELGHTFRMMGLQTEDIMEHQAKYMAQQARFGMLQSKSVEQLIKGTADYIIELDKTAALTGASRKDQEESMKFVMANEKLRAGMLVEEEKAKKTGDYTILNQMQQASNLAARLYEAGQKRAATGAAEYYGSGKTTTGLESAEFYATFRATIKDINEGRKSDTVLFLQSTKEAYNAASRVAGARRFGANTEGLLGDSTQSIVDTRLRTKQIEEEAERRGIKQNTPEFEKLVQELGKTRVATDGLTAEQVKLREANRDKAIAQDDAVRAKSLSAILGAGLGPPADAMMNAGNTMLEAAKKMWESVFGKAIEAPKSNTVLSTETKATESRQASDNATQSLLLIEDRKKAAEAELKAMYKRGASQEELAKQDKKILELEKEQVEAVRKDNVASQQKMQDALTAKNERLRQRKLENTLEPLTKEAATIQEQLNKLNAEKEEIEKEGKSRPGTTRDQNDRKLMLEGVNEDIKKIRKELDEKLKQVSAIKTEIGPSAPASPQSDNSKAYARTQRQGGAGASTAASASNTTAAPAAPNQKEQHAPASQGSTTPKLTSVSSKSGKSASVGSDYAPQFQKLVDYLDTSKYDIVSMGGYNDRDVRGKPGVKSVHAYGGALDINPATNPSGSNLVTDMPSEISSIAAGLGLGWGGNWTTPKDAMHFSAAESEGGSLLKAFDGGLFKSRPGGVNVNLAERAKDEAVVPLNPGEKIRVEKENQGNSSRKDPLSTVMATDTPFNSNQSVEILAGLLNMMENKFDELISASRDGNDISDKLLKYSRV